MNPRVYCKRGDVSDAVTRAIDDRLGAVHKSTHNAGSKSRPVVGGPMADCKAWIIRSEAHDWILCIDAYGTYLSFGRGGPWCWNCRNGDGVGKKATEYDQDQPHSEQMEGNS